KAASLTGPPPLPGQNPALLHSCEYASRVIGSAPSRGGARRPEKRVTAKSKLPQKKWTGLFLPMNRERNSLNKVSVTTRMFQNLLTSSRSYDACCVSCSKEMGFGTSTGMLQIFTWIPRDSSPLMNSR